MMINQKALGKAVELCTMLDKTVSETLPDEIVKIIKQHAFVAVGLTILPMPGIDVAIYAISLWTMYVRINKLVGNTNLLHTISSGVITNLLAAVAVSIVSTFIDMIPVAGFTINIFIGALQYFIIYASGCTYIESLIRLFKKTNIKKGSYTNSVKGIYDKNKHVFTNMKADYDELKKQGEKPIESKEQERIEQ